ncbi:MAG: isoprenyl transferase [Firmicutes bacterium]|nr:isoprenyl transferase [Bacillota bacterium]
MLDMDRIPSHVAIIMDGNGRWAKKRGLPRLAGHNAGMKSMIEIVRRSKALGLDHLTLYAFSTENWKRSAEEVSGIFKLLIRYVESELRVIMDNNVRIRILGDYSPLPKDSRAAVEKAITQTAGNTGMQLNIALNYGGRAEILRAVQHLASDAKAGRVDPEEITEESISDYLYTGRTETGCGDPELIIRTSGEERLSNFLLWQSAYSEFVFTDVLWPDFTPEEYEKCLEEYQSRDRRFGGRK